MGLGQKEFNACGMAIAVNYSPGVIARDGGRSSIPEAVAIETISRGVPDSRFRGE